MDAPTPPPEPSPAHSDLVGLHADYEEIRRLMDAHKRPIDTPTTDDADRAAVVGDNFVSCMNLTAALGLLFDERNHEGATVVFRALYEACINLVYLYDVGDRTRNALLARAYALQEIAENHGAAGDRLVADEHRRLFEKMPKAIRHELAANKKRERNHWSGVGLATRAERVGFIGHRIMYRGTSWEAHALALGRLPFVQKGENLHEIHLHRSLSDKSAEGLARLARLLLRQAWARFSREFIGSAIRLSAPPPDPNPGTP